MHYQVVGRHLTVPVMASTQLVLHTSSSGKVVCYQLHSIALKKVVHCASSGRVLRQLWLVVVCASSGQQSVVLVVASTTSSRVLCYQVATAVYRCCCPRLPRQSHFDTLISTFTPDSTVQAKVNDFICVFCHLSPYSLVFCILSFGKGSKLDN